MSIANELSCDVAAAMLAERRDEPAGNAGGDLTEIVLEVHSTLRRLTSEARRDRFDKRLSPEQPKQPTGISNAASGSH